MQFQRLHIISHRFVFPLRTEHRKQTVEQQTVDKNFFHSSQTASLFYDQIKINDYDTDIPSLFQNYSRCFSDSSVQPKKINSANQKYRTIDGSENNPNKAMMGASFTSYGRLLKAQYNDNIHSIRKSIRGYNLPSPRNIVRKLFLNDEVNLNKFKNRRKIPNMAAVMFGQYIAHDVGSRQANQYVDGGNGKRNFTQGRH